MFGVLSLIKARIVKVDNFAEITPEKNMLIYKNVDKPGIIDASGPYLAKR